MKKIGLLLALVYSGAIAESPSRPPARDEGCVAGARHIAEVEQQSSYHRYGIRIGRNSYHAQEVRPTPDQSYSQTAQMQPYFSGFCNPAFPSSCPR